MSETMEKKRKLDTDEPKPESESENGSKSESKTESKTEAKTNDDGESYYELSNKKRITVRKWKGNIMVDVREFYEKGDKQLPGKKGLSLTLDQYKVLSDLIKSGSIDEAVKKVGGDL